MRRQYTLSLSEAADFSSLASYYHHNSFCAPFENSSIVPFEKVFIVVHPDVETLLCAVCPLCI